MPCDLGDLSKQLLRTRQYAFRPSRPSSVVLSPLQPVNWIYLGVLMCLYMVESDLIVRCGGIILIPSLPEDVASFIARVTTLTHGRRTH